MRTELKLKDGNMVLALDALGAARKLFGGSPVLTAKIDPLLICPAGWCEAGTIEVGGKPYDYFKDHEKYVFMEA